MNANFEELTRILNLRGVGEEFEYESLGVRQDAESEGSWRGI